MKASTEKPRQSSPLPFKQLSIPLGPIGPISVEFSVALERAQAELDHDLRACFEHHPPGTCAICDRREPAPVPSLLGRWGDE